MVNSDSGIADRTELNLHLTPQLQRITLPSLILEMNLCHQCGELTGETDEQLYQSFAEGCLFDEHWREEFYQESPILYRCVKQAMDNTVASVSDMIHCFDRDRALINEQFFSDKPYKHIIRIDSSDSDGHCGGKRVYILWLDNGERLVYKPRSLSMDVAFADMVRWVSDGIGVDFPWNKVIDRGQYGWCEWVEASPCEQIEELERYYRRNGILLAVSYLLGSSDFHYENLIAHGEYPVIIDLEMGVGRRIRTEKRSADPAQELYRDSVLRTGLLPMFAWNEHGEGVNVGAISAEGGDLVPIKVPMIAQPGSIRMHIEYAQPKMKPAKNLATLNGRFIEPYQFRQQIKEGFEQAYRFIMEHKVQVLERLARCKDVSVRFLANHTQLYTMFLITSYLPGYLQKENGRRQILDQIKSRMGDSEAAGWVHRQEVEELLGGDVPYFRYTIGGTTLCSGTGEEFKNFFAEWVETEIAQRLWRMNTENMEQQKRLIDSTLLIGERGKRDNGGEGRRAEETRSKATRIGNEGTAVCDTGIRLEIAKAVGDILVDEAIWDEKRQTVSWLGIMLAGFREQGYLIRPMGPYLYDGWAGVALFMIGLARETGEQKYTELAERLKKQLIRHTDELCEALYKQSSGVKRCSGAYTGEASVAYTYQLLYDREQDETYLAYMEKQCEALPEICRFDRSYDVLGGNAGAILVLLNAYDMTGNEKYLRWAREAGDHLIASATKYEWGGWGWITPSIGKALTGFAHGASGIMYALARLSDYLRERKYEEAAYRAFRFEMHYYRKEKKDWTDLRYTDEQEKLLNYDTAWCHGWGGILMAAQATKKYVQSEWREELENIAVKVVPRKRYQRDETGYSLCHGKLGNVALLHGMGERELAGQRYREILQELGDSVENIRKRLGQQECENFGLMGGITGIGYACLYGAEETGERLQVGRK